MNIEVVKNHLKKNYPFYIIFALAAIVYFAVIYPAINNDLIFYDSIYQYFLTNKSFKEMMELIPMDYSPALYSIFLKAFTVIFGTTFNQMRLSSVVVFLGLTLTCIFPLRRAFGDKVAIVSALCLMLSSTSYHLYVQIRPQALGLLFLTTAAVYVYLIYKEGKKHDYIFFTIFSILAMNTHNVAMFTMFSYYVMLFVVFLFGRKFKEIKKLIISGLVCAVTYIPSLLVIVKQFGNVKKNYWEDGRVNFPRILFNTFLLNVNNNYHSEFPLYFYILSFVFELAILGAVLFVAARTVLNYTKTKKFSVAVDKDSCFILGLFVVPILLFCFVVVFIVPIMTERYLYMFSGITIIILVALLSKVDKKNIVLCLLSAFFVVNFVMATKNFKDYTKENNIPSKIEAIKAEYGENIAFVHSHEWTVGIMEYYFPDARHYVTDNTHTVLNTLDVFSTENIYYIGDPENIKDYEDEFFVFNNYFLFSDWNGYEYYANYDYYEFSSDNIAYVGSDQPYYPIFVHVTNVSEN